MLNFMPRRIEPVQYQELPEENELMIVCEGSGQVKVLNWIAGGIWLLCDGTRSPTDMCQLLHQSHPDIDVNTLEQHVVDVLNFLKHEDLIV